MNALFLAMLIGVTGQPTGYATGQLSPTSDLSSNRVKATGSTTPQALKDWMASWANVKGFGAKGDGVTDDTNALNAALNASNMVYLPPGTYIISDTLTYAISGRIMGAGSTLSIIQWKSGASGTGKALLRLAGRSITIQGVGFQGDSFNSPDTGIDLYPTTALIAQMHVFDDVWVGTSSPPGVGLWSHDPPSGQQHEMMDFRNSRISGLNAGVKFDKIHEDLWHFRGCYIGHTSASGASMLFTANANGMGLLLDHSWLIGPHYGMQFQTNSHWDDIVFKDSGNEGPTTFLEYDTNAVRILWFGQGPGGLIHVNANRGLWIRSTDSNWFTTTAGAKQFQLDSSSNVLFDSTKDYLYLDSIIQTDPAAWAAQAYTGSGLFVMNFEGSQYRSIAQPTRFGGSYAAYGFSTSTPMVEVAPALNSQPAMRVTAYSATPPGSKLWDVDSNGYIRPNGSFSIQNDNSGPTSLQVIANSTSNAGVVLFSRSGVSNSPWVQLAHVDTEARITVDKNGSGTQKDLSVIVGGAEQFRVMTTGGVKIGQGTAITKSVRATATLSTTTINATSCATDQTITTTGTATGAECVVGAPTAIDAGLVLTCYASAADTVKLRVCNPTAGAITPAGSQTVSVRVFNP